MGQSLAAAAQVAQFGGGQADRLFHDDQPGRLRQVEQSLQQRGVIGVGDADGHQIEPVALCQSRHILGPRLRLPFLGQGLGPARGGVDGQGQPEVRVVGNGMGVGDDGPLRRGQGSGDLAGTDDGGG